MTPAGGGRYGHVTVGSSFTPTDLTNLKAWYDASNAGSITQSGGLVSQWNDLSGNGKHLVQATGSIQPTTASHTMNSKNVIYFPLAGGYKRMAPGSNPLAGATACTALYVAKQVDLTNQVAPPISGPGGGQDSWYPYSDNNRYEWFGTSVRKSWANATTLNVAHVTSITSASGAYTVYHNGASEFTTGTNTVSVASSMLVSDNNAGGTGFGGDIAEIILTSDALGTTDRTNAENYLIAKWGI